MGAFVRGLIGVAVAAASLAAQAKPVNYDESVSGDLSSSNLLTTFALDMGSNKVSGRLGASNSPSSSDFDSFAFTVAPGTQLVSFQVSLEDAIGNLASTSWSLMSGSSLWGQGTLIGNYNVSSPGTANGGPLQAGLYQFANTSIGWNGVQGYTDYTFTFSVRPLNQVPEPGSLVLVAAALIAAAAGARRRRR